MLQVMSNHVSKYVLLVILSLITACNQQEKEIKERNHKILELSKANTGTQEYNRLYKQASDSLNNWCQSKLPVYESIWSFNYRLDSVLCFNSKKDRMITAILVQCDRSTCVQDDVHYFYGVKIKERWYFLRGPSVTLPREYYQSDVHTPLSFQKLHEIAMKEIFQSYLKKNKKDEWEINDVFFTSRLEGVGWGDFNNQHKEDWFLKGKRFTNQKDYYEFIYMDAVKKNWSMK